ncbi:hypothetical protein [Anaerobacillus alkalidiazotrophicus]|uniref:hypothetical protein n=1 Tax=Anaerobacillus alkalidiazotrophicus TaxID=472963 RepID=UPI0014713C60|nr:hypothetical protein [Anaerobacillus alkalidiazotrophicus]
MDNKLYPLIYELKGVVYSVETMMSQDQDVDYQLIERIQTIVNQAVEMIEK